VYERISSASPKQHGTPYSRDVILPRKAPFIET
jgi:hypothetical protein